MARYIRLYNSPDHENPGSILGFSRGIADGAYDTFLHGWLKRRSYRPTEESAEQRQSHIVLRPMPKQIAQATLIHMAMHGVKPEYLFAKQTIPTQAYYTAPGIPLPPDTVSVSHLLIEPPLRDADLGPLGLCLSSLKSVYDAGLRKHYFVDSRTKPPQQEDISNILYNWG